MDSQLLAAPITIRTSECIKGSASGIHSVDRPPTASERAALATDRARIADIDARISALEQSLRALQEEKTSVQDRLDAYTYPVLTLPNEIVSEIFVHFLPPYPKRPLIIGLRSPILLGQICRKWREIALSTPALWRRVAVSLRSLKRRDQKLILLKTFLARSGSCPLSVSLRSGISNDSERLMAPFLESIMSHSPRWEHVKLPIMSPLSLRYLEGPLDFLRSLNFPSPIRIDPSHPDDSAITLAFHAAPLLDSVNLRTFSPFYYPILPWLQLTHLTVYRINSSNSTEILNLTPNLVYCKMRLFPDVPDGQPRRALNT
ncbi:hypothetical protein B0H11DRAFT_1849617 [Mycena galericulata]|nr:hypothetical protein B0H11DRAFT_1849617 [Mycena galericulata]